MIFASCPTNYSSSGLTALFMAPQTPILYSHFPLWNVFFFLLYLANLISVFSSNLNTKRKISSLNCYFLLEKFLRWSIFFPISFLLYFYTSRKLSFFFLIQLESCLGQSQCFILLCAVIPVKFGEQHKGCFRNLSWSMKLLTIWMLQMSAKFEIFEYRIFQGLFFPWTLELSCLLVDI
jgi:hypothetical protein